ncbi:35746_t:CDS:2, partial [Gigaspora margarita]
EIYQLFQPMLNILASKHPIAQEDNYYLHIYATRLFNDIENNKIASDVIKHDLVLHFRNKECVMPNELKNNIIYNNADDIAFEEILRIYLEQGNDIFFPCEYGVTEKDLFRPAEMLTRKILSIRAPKIYEAKPRKINSFAPIIDKENFLANNVLMLLDEVELSNVFEPKETLASNMREALCPLALSVQKRLTTAICNCKRSISNKRDKLEKMRVRKGLY